jgi:hypothetical protein
MIDAASGVAPVTVRDTGGVIRGIASGTYNPKDRAIEYYAGLGDESLHHEMSHAVFPDQGWGDVYVDYHSRPDERQAHLSGAMYAWLKETGRAIINNKDAKDFLDWFKDTPTYNALKNGGLKDEDILYIVPKLVLGEGDDLQKGRV